MADWPDPLPLSPCATAAVVVDFGFEEVLVKYQATVNRLIVEFLIVFAVVAFVAVCIRRGRLADWPLPPGGCSHGLWCVSAPAQEF